MRPSKGVLRGVADPQPRSQDATSIEISGPFILLLVKTNLVEGHLEGIRQAVSQSIKSRWIERQFWKKQALTPDEVGAGLLSGSDHRMRSLLCQGSQLKTPPIIAEGLRRVYVSHCAYKHLG